MNAKDTDKPATRNTRSSTAAAAKAHASPKVTTARDKESSDEEAEFEALINKRTTASSSRKQVLLEDTDDEQADRMQLDPPALAPAVDPSTQEKVSNLITPERASAAGTKVTFQPACLFII